MGSSGRWRRTSAKAASEPRVSNEHAESLLTPAAARVAELLVSVAFTASGGALMVASIGLGLSAAVGPGPGLFPFLSGSVLLVAGAVSVVRDSLNLRTDSTTSSPAGDRARWSRPAIAIGLYVLYVLLLAPLGFVVATAMLLFSLLLFVGGRPVWSSLAITVGAVIVLRIGLGELLEVPLPLSRIIFLNWLGL